MSLTKILIVEDEKLVADDLRETLELLNYEVVYSTASGEEALNRIAENKPDLVIMDIRLGGQLDGIEATQMIQSQYRIPVVYLTANADASTLKRVKASQPFGYILKPFTEKILMTTIEVALARHLAESAIHTALDEAQINQSEIRTLLQKKSDYLHLLVHELRNPLTAIKFAAEVLQHPDTEITDDRRDRYIQRIRAATKSLNELVEDALLLEKSSSCELEFFPTSVDLKNFCAEIIEAFQLTTTTAHQFSFSSTGRERRLQLDEKLLWHLFTNLVSNAVKYSPQGGTVALGLLWEGDCVRVSVADEGIGIPPETEFKLFDPFHRGRNVGAIPGTGLGLAIAKRCAELQGGAIAVQSTLHQGSTFTVVFPYAKADG